jgi:hypothetical protein
VYRHRGPPARSRPSDADVHMDRESESSGHAKPFLSFCTPLMDSGALRSDRNRNWLCGFSRRRARISRNSSPCSP